MRLLGGSACASVVVLLCVASCGDNTALQSSSAPTVSAPDAPSTSPAAPDTSSAAAETTSLDTTAATVAETGTTLVPTNSSVPENTVDPADQYLGQTTEIYRRPLPDGHDIVVRLSDGSYADVFGYVWTAPTGSATACFGDHAVFVGVPGEIGYNGSAWTVGPWYDEIDPTQAAIVQGLSWMAAMPVADESGDSVRPPTQYLLIRTHDGASDVILAAADGTELDRSPVMNRVAMVVVTPEAAAGASLNNDLQISVLDANGQASDRASLTSGAPSPKAECGPGEPPRKTLPPPGAQPDDPVAAEAQIRERYALLVDQTITSDQKPADLLDDNTGVDDAVAELHSGQYKDVAAGASYSIDELVFTSPAEAWFRYSISTSLGPFADRLGIARFNGVVWQTTRATICQDLALAMAPCQPTSPDVSTPEYDAALKEWMARANLYAGNDGCAPLSRC